MSKKKSYEFNKGITVYFNDGLTPKNLYHAVADLGIEGFAVSKINDDVYESEQKKEHTESYQMKRIADMMEEKRDGDNYLSQLLHQCQEEIPEELEKIKSYEDFLEFKKYYDNVVF